jgi:hypothetical protein
MAGSLDKRAYSASYGETRFLWKYCLPFREVLGLVSKVELSLMPSGPQDWQPTAS